jgi:hypothetical protein
MARENQLSRWGAISKVLEKVSPYSKVFFVGDSDDAGFQDFVEEFPPDKDGVVRVYSSIFDATMLANARAGRGDVILVMPGHVEAITTDKSLAVKGLKVIGLGEGSERPVIRYDDTAASVSLDAEGVHLENFRLLASVSGITLGVDVVGNGCVVRKCSLEFDANGDDFVTGISVKGDKCAIEENEILGEDTVGPAVGIQLSGADYTKIRKNYLTGQFSNAAISDTSVSKAVLIGENFINNQDTAGAIAIAMLAGSTGLAYKNMMAVSDTASGIGSNIAAGGVKWVENYLVNDTAETGGLVPRTVSSS